MLLLLCALLKKWLLFLHFFLTVLIGHSDGGTIALITAAIHGKTVCAIITEAAHIFVEGLTIAGICKAFEATPFKKKLARHHKKNTETIFTAGQTDGFRPNFRAGILKDIFLK